MSTEKEFNNGNAVTIKMSQLVYGVNVIFSGVVEILKALEVSTAEELVKTMITEENAYETETAGTEGSADASDGADAVPDAGNAADVKTEPEEKAAPERTEQPVEGKNMGSRISADDITKVIVRKIKKDRSNNEKIGAILKTYGVAKVSELPESKYEAFLTDLSAL